MEEESNHISMPKKIIFYSLGIIGIAALGYFAFKFAKGKKSALDYYRHAQLFHNIELANQQAQQSLCTLNIERKVEKIGQKITIIFNLITKLKEKINHSTGNLRNPFAPPFQPGLFICELPPNHRLLFNKFNIYKNHLLVVTQQFEPQLNRLTEKDFEQAIFVYQTIKGLLFYNRGPKSGASQLHKHIQIFPCDGKHLPIISEILQKSILSSSNKIFEYEGFNFKHGIFCFSNHQSHIQLSQKMKKAQQQLYDKLIQNQDVDYNLIGCDQFLMMVPRKKQKAFGQLSVNAVGFMGSLLFKDEIKMNEYYNSNSITPSAILEDVTYPKQ